MVRDQRRSFRLRNDHGGALRNGSDDRGSALIEAAIILPFLVLMIFGIVELGFLFRSAAVVNSSTRSGARLAAAQYASAVGSTNQLSVVDNVALTVEKDLDNRGSDDTPQILWIYQAGANGKPLGQSDFSACNNPCFKYNWDPSANSGKGGFVRQAGGSWPSPVVCGTAHDSVGVYVKVSHAPIGFTNFLGTLSLNESTVMILEPPAAGTTQSCPQGS